MTLFARSQPVSLEWRSRASVISRALVVAYSLDRRIRERLFETIRVGNSLGGGVGCAMDGWNGCFIFSVSPTACGQEDFYFPGTTLPACCSGWRRGRLIHSCLPKAKSRLGDAFIAHTSTMKDGNPMATAATDMVSFSSIGFGSPRTESDGFSGS